MAYIDQFLKHGMVSRASDIHFSAGEPVRMRVDGDLVVMEPTPMTSEQLEGLFREIMAEEEWAKFEANKNLDKSYAVEGIANFRVNIYLTRRGFAAVVRSIPSKIPTMQELGLPESVQALTGLAKGLVLVTGPTGSGKSTTLAAMINHINQNNPYHILTAEDPVEFVHPSKMSLINQREIGSNCHSFADALKYALREDPDVILVGEMRDLETISLALTAAETGHLVLGTLHTRGAAASVDRIIDSFPANQQAMVRTMLAESLMGVISQVLLKKKDQPGRVAAYEIMVANHAISNLIREGKTFQIPSIIQTGRKDGMILMSQHLRDLIANGVIDEAEAAPYLEDGSTKGGKAPAKPAAPTARPQPSPAPMKAMPFTPKPLEASVPPVTRPQPAVAPATGARPTITAAPKPQASAAPKPPPIRSAPPAAASVKPAATAPANEEDVSVEIQLPEDNSLEQVEETSGIHLVNQQRSTKPPPAPGVPPVGTPFKKTGT